MSNIVTDKIIPDSGSSNTLTVGGTGDSVVVLDSLNVNSLQDAGGNNIFVSNGSGTITSKNSGVSGALNLISTQTASNSASVAITSGIDSTYDVYMLKLINIHPDTDNVDFNFNGSIDGGSNYNVTKTTTQFRAYHNEDNSGTPAVAYNSGGDLAQSTADQRFMGGASGGSSDEDSTTEITMHLFGPSNTTYVKQFYMDAQGVKTGPSASVQTSSTYFTAGYFNTTSAINALIFRCGSGNFDGTIKLYGISKS